MEQLGIKKMQGSIVEMLKDEILSGHIACGTEMTQNELAASLGVSRMPVREALIILEFQGLIERLPNNHVRAAEFTEDYFQKLFRLCADLEMDVLQETGNVPGAPEVRNVPGAPEVRNVPNAPETPWNVRENGGFPGELEFHREVYRASSHSYMRKTLQTITEIYIGFALTCQGYDQKRGRELLKQVINCVQGEKGVGGPGGAVSLLNQYFDGLAKAIMRERMR